LLWEPPIRAAAAGRHDRLAETKKAAAERLVLVPDFGEITFLRI
jgi:hypothetical protein